MVYKLAKRGMPTSNLEAAAAWRKANIDPFRSKSGRIGGNSGTRYEPIAYGGDDETGMLEAIKDDVIDSQLDLDGDNADEIFINARALREKSRALQAAARYRKFRDSLVEKAALEKIIAVRTQQFREGIAVTSRRIAEQVAGKESLAEAEAIMNNGIRAMLEGLANLPPVED